MKTMGFLISNKIKENRRVLNLTDLDKIRNIDYIYFEKGYGDVFGYSDEDFKNKGVHVVEREVIYQQDIISDLFFTIPFKNEYLKNKTFFGWTIETVPKKEIMDFFLNSKMTVIAWQEMYKNGRHVFWKNNKIAGEAAIFHAFLHYGKMPYDCSVAVIGKGNAAYGAIQFLEKMCAKVTIYDKTNSIFLRNELQKYDVIVNAVKWDFSRKDRLIYKEDLKYMKKDSLIVDISCNEGFEIETSYATTIEKPVYVVDGVMHYAVDHVPTIFWKTSTNAISKEVVEYIDDLLEEKSNKTLINATIADDGKILNEKYNLSY